MLLFECITNCQYCLQSNCFNLVWQTKNICCSFKWKTQNTNGKEKQYKIYFDYNLVKMLQIQNAICLINTKLFSRKTLWSFQSFMHLFTYLFMCTYKSDSSWYYEKKYIEKLRNLNDKLRVGGVMMITILHRSSLVPIAS